MRHSIVVLAFACTSTLLLGACSNSDATPPAARPVLVEPPQAYAGESGEVFPGTVHAREEAQLSFRIAGKMRTRQVDVGESVKKGQVLATLDPADSRLNLDAARAALNATQADVTLASADLRRYKDLLDKGYITASVYDARSNALKLAEAHREQAQSNLAVAANQTDYTSLRAGKDGLITAVLAEAGQVVAAGQPVFGFAAQSQREVQIDVAEGRVAALQNAPVLHVALWAHPGRLYQGKLRVINLQADNVTRTHEARVTIVDADDAVQLGTTASVLMGERVDPNTYIVPLSALVKEQGQPSVWIVSDGHAHRLAVKVIRYVEDRAIVSGALSPQMQMVSAGASLLTENQTVRALPRQRPTAQP
ncbi:MAG: efflux RND transporter periplasmic adaptor subunit [Stenotrophobium sp.]